MNPPLGTGYDNKGADIAEGSQDFDDLIYALKAGAGAGLSPNSEASQGVDNDTAASDNSDVPFEMRRISMADTHL